MIVGPTVAPTGTVTFLDYGVSIGTVALSGGAATFTTAKLSADEIHAISVQYNGTASIAASVSAVTLVVVNPAPTTVSVTDSEVSDGNVFYYGTPLTITAQVTAPGSTATPTGSVLFFSDGTGNWACCDPC